MIEFVDTNVLLYSCDTDATLKHDLSVALLSRLFAERAGALSVQVLSEFYSNATRKFGMTSHQAETVLEDYVDWRLHPR